MEFGKDSIDYLSSKQDDFGWKQPDFEDKGKSKELAKDLRAHHFKLGSDAPTLKSDYAQKFTEKKPLDADKSGFQDPYKNSFSVRHHPYNQHGAYVSEYKDSTNGELTPEEKAAAGLNGNKDGKGTLQSTINLGDEDLGPGISENHAKFIKKDLDSRGQIDNKLLKSNLHFGDYAVDYGTTYKNEHTNKGVLAKDNTSHEIMMDLRANHYELGYQGVSSPRSTAETNLNRDISGLLTTLNTSTEVASRAS
jgi:hypothetical protein